MQRCPMSPQGTNMPLTKKSNCDFKAFNLHATSVYVAFKCRAQGKTHLIYKRSVSNLFSHIVCDKWFNSRSAFQFFSELWTSSDGLDKEMKPWLHKDVLWSQMEMAFLTLLWLPADSWWYLTPVWCSFSLLSSLLAVSLMFCFPQLFHVMP